MATQKLLIALAGPPSCGKDTVATYLETLGFVHVSTGDLVRKHIAENQMGEPTRPLLQRVANELREKFGPEHLTKMALQSTTEKIVVSGLRNPAEVKPIHEAGGKLIIVTAPLEKRYEWAKMRGRIGDNITFEDFKIQEEVEHRSQDKNAQNVEAVMALADFIVQNDGTVKDLHTKIDQILQSLGNQVQ